MREDARHGWNSSFGDFSAVEKSKVLQALRDSYPDSSSSELRSWTVNVPLLQNEVRQSMQMDQSINACTAVLEYQLPMELRRPDAVLLLRGGVAILELKGAVDANDAAVDQAHAYARDLRNYHRSCHSRLVTPVVVPTGMRGNRRFERDVHVCPPDQLDGLLNELDSVGDDRIDPTEFLAVESYKPLPSLVTAARKLFFEKRPPQLWRSIANTDDAVTAVLDIIREARATQTRRLVLLTGVPGAGKTLVGLRVAHAPSMGPTDGNRQRPRAIFLSGNGPLVDVLQYVLESKVFVRPVKTYINRHKDRPSLVPNENVVIFDEAQRAHDADRVSAVHNAQSQQSEPELLIEFAGRRSDWAVVVGLIGNGQEIHVGEEAGIDLWVKALANSSAPRAWHVHGPQTMRAAFNGLKFSGAESLNLGKTIRSHMATELHAFVERILRRKPDAATSLLPIATRLERKGHDLRVTRSLDQAKAYLQERYAEHSEARFGLVASSRDKDLERSYGIPNGWMSTRQIRYGPWYNDSEDDDGARSCRRLRTCVTEFGAQGLELDAVLFAWGTDFILQDGEWSNRRARGYKRPFPADPWQLRANAYRVLLTRGRDAHVVFVPELGVLDETYRYLVGCGFRRLKT